MAAQSLQARYFALLKEHVAHRQEESLMVAADLGRELVLTDIPPEEIVEIHHEALSRLARECPNLTLRDVTRLITAPLLEVFMAYGLAYREQFEARQRADEQLRLQGAALAAAANAMVITDHEGRIVWVNPAFTRLTGYTPEDAVGQNPRLLKSGAQDQAFYRRLWDTILAGQVWRGELINRRKDGSLYTEEQTITPVRTMQGLISHFIAIKQDITERRRLEREILEISEREQRRLGQDLHDDLAQHLTGLGFLSRGLEQKLVAQSLPEASLMARITHLINAAITQTHQMARGFYPVILETDGLGAALQMLAEQAHTVFGIHLQVTAETSMSVPDPTMGIHLYRIAQEAITNAVKHGRAQRVVISLTAEPHGLRLSIDDDGVGIPDAAAAGQGMGLRIMRYRARLLGATLEVGRLAQGGTRVTCTLPPPPAA